MNVIFFVLPIILVIGSTVYFNVKKLTGSKIEVILISFGEIIFTSAIISLLFTEGFLLRIGQLILVLMVLLVGLFIVLFKHVIGDEMSDLYFETIKNNLIVFGRTILPFYVALTIFRFLPLWQQLLFSLLVVVVVVLLSKITEKIGIRIHDRIILSFSTTYVLPTVLSVAMVFAVILISTFFSIPTSVSQSLHLDTVGPVLEYRVTDSYMSNNFLVEEVNTVDNKVYDYTVFNNQEYYFYSQYIKVVGEDDTIIPIVFTGSVNERHFIELNNHLYTVGSDGIYSLANNTVSIVSRNAGKIVRMNDAFYILEYKDDSYTLIDNDFNEVTPDVTYGSLEVVNEQLFVKEDNVYTLYENPSISFSGITTGSLLYDEINEYLYEYHFNTMDLTVVLDQYSTTGLLKSQTFKTREYNPEDVHLFIIGDTIYLIDGYNTITTINDDLNRESYYTIPREHGFIDTITTSYRGTINRLYDDNGTVKMMINYKQKFTKIYSISTVDLAMDTVLYYEFGVNIVFVIVFAMFLSYTDYRKHITILDFKSRFQKQ